MGYREVRIVDVREVLRRWQKGQGARRIAGGTSLSRGTVRRYLKEAGKLGITREGSEPSEEQLAELARRFRPGRRPTEDDAAARLASRREDIRRWLEEEELQLTRVHELLTEKDVEITYATLRRVVISWVLGRPKKIMSRRWLARALRACEPAHPWRPSYPCSCMAWLWVSVHCEPVAVLVCPFECH